MSFFDSTEFVFLITLPFYLCGAIMLLAVRKGSIPKWLKYWPIPQYHKDYSKVDRIRIHGLSIALVGVVCFIWATSPGFFPKWADMLRNKALIGIISYALLVIGIYLADKISFILFTKIILKRKHIKACPLERR